MIPENVPTVTAPLRVLIVDDNEASAKTLGWALEAAGHEVTIAPDGRTAIEAAQEIAPQVVLLDIGLPGMNGYEICQVMKQSPALAKTIFIAQTGWSGEENRRLSEEAGFDHYLVKPVSIDALAALLASFTAQRIAN
jgi:CheY-like chemotaxis protein